MHQKTLLTIQKRKGPLVNSINRYNKYVDTLRSLKQPSWNILVPSKLPTNLRELWEESDIMEDIWLTPTNDFLKPLPAWMVDSNMRKGSKALVKLECCVEERTRIDLEAKNLAEWFFEELCALELASILSKRLRFLYYANRQLLTQIDRQYSFSSYR
jgi:hypothetical protein